MDQSLRGYQSDTSKIAAHQQFALGKKIDQNKSHHKEKKDIKNASHKHQNKDTKQDEKAVVQKHHKQEAKPNMVKEERSKIVKKPQEELKVKRDEHVERQPKAIKPVEKAVEHKEKKTPQKVVVIKNDHRDEPQVHHRAARLPQVKPAEIAPKPKKVDAIIPIIKKKQPVVLPRKIDTLIPVI